MMTRPITILGFNRPDYMAAVCESLAPQVFGRKVRLMQDGAVSARTGFRYAEDSQITESIAAFRNWFPAGEIIAQPNNIGIARQIMLAEFTAFERDAVTDALFFEDDMILGPSYVAMLDHMLDNAPANVGYVAAYGTKHGGYGLDALNPKLAPMPLNWGFGMRREAWFAILGWIAPFHRLYLENDYALRDKLAILRLYLSRNVATLMETQDALRATACADLGIGRVNLNLNYGRYIGVRGASMTPERYDELGLGNMTIYPTPETMPIMDEAEINRLIERDRAEARTIRQTILEPYIRHMESTLIGETE